MDMKRGLFNPSGWGLGKSCIGNIRLKKLDRWGAIVRAPVSPPAGCAGGHVAVDKHGLQIAINLVAACARPAGVRG